MLINHNAQRYYRAVIAQSLFGQLGDFGIGVRKIGIVDVLGNKTLVAMFALVAVSVIAILPTFDD